MTKPLSNAVLGLKPSGIRKFFDIVRPYLQYIPNEFHYKFNMQYTPGRGRDTIELAKKYNL